MLKYLLKVFDEKNELIIQVIVPSDDLWSSLDNLSKFGIVKGTLLNEESN